MLAVARVHVARIDTHGPPDRWALHRRGHMTQPGPHYRIRSIGQSIPKAPATGNHGLAAPVHVNCPSAMPWVNVYRK